MITHTFNGPFSQVLFESLKVEQLLPLDVQKSNAGGLFYCPHTGLYVIYRPNAQPEPLLRLVGFESPSEYPKLIEEFAQTLRARETDE